MDEFRLDIALKAAGVQEYRYFYTIGSTNDEALSWMDTGAPDFSLVIAEEQTRGKGRFNRHWVTNPGSSLAFSVIIKPTLSEISSLPFFAPLCGLAVHDSLYSLFSLESEIKWPNDILINKKKCCGILVEATWSADLVNGIVLGIGINISSTSVPSMAEQLFNATCLEESIRKSVDRYLLLGEILKQIQKWRTLLGSRPFFERWEKYLAFKGEQVMIVQSEKQSIIGIEKGIDSKGNLLIILDTQEEISCEVGDVHLRPLTTTSETGGNHA